ncbi:hypothetical protein HPB52_003582 [Rhipicephalus sanguineus]|uniref:Uncharacterized protein n=1 Tax=Rhipicephalus sanguineus TaxID=34632 RepID=A0A9D4QHE7_RHISA|nr:hypothetical protein HPB52_003582 [Rhipicephalus sanguineus]
MSPSSQNRKAPLWIDVPQASGLLLHYKQKSLSKVVFRHVRRSSNPYNGSLFLHDHGTLQARCAFLAVSADSVHLLVCQISFTGTMSAVVVLMPALPDDQGNEEGSPKMH